MTVHYFIGAETIDPNSDQGQLRLDKAHAASERVICSCSSKRPEMYVARINGRYVVKRMPDTGFDHAPDCSSFLPPDALTGRSALQGTAIEERPEDGTTLLRLDFSLSKGTGRTAPPPSSGATATEVTATPKKLGLTALLHYLWDDAGLCKWTPALEGKRSWGVVQRRIMQVAASKLAKSSSVAERLIVPEPFKIDNRDRIGAEQSADIRRITSPSGRYGLLIAEYKDHKPTRLGARFLFKHMPSTSFFADDDFVKRFEAVSAGHLSSVDMIENGHLMTISTFKTSEQGYPVLIEMGFMPVTSQWLPFDHMNDVELINAMCRAKRSFTKSLRYNLRHDAPIASMMPTDTDELVMMFIQTGKGTTSDTPNDDEAYDRWIWQTDEAMPTLPAPQQRSNYREQQ